MSDELLLERLAAMVNKERNAAHGASYFTDEAADEIDARYDELVAQVTARFEPVDQLVDDVDYVDFLAQSDSGVPMF